MVQTYQIIITIISGVSIFILGQWFIEFVIKPRKNYLETWSEIQFTIIYYSNKLHNFIKNGENSKTNEYEKLELKLRELSANLHSKYHAQNIVYKIRNESRVNKTIGLLIGISNTGHNDHFEDRLEFLKELREIL